ncbi:MAG: MGMT family protein [Bryobacterales bacterium]|nr:MGMT family protein [Bryobacterales bacterium]
MKRKPARITKRGILRLGQFDPSPDRDRDIRRTIRQIPKGQVATYGQVAAAAGYPLYHRQVARLLRNSGDSLPWQRILGAGGRIRLRGAMALEQRTRLETEGVRFRGQCVDMAAHQHVFRTWEQPCP